MILREERQMTQMAEGFEDHLYWLRPLRVIISIKPKPNPQDAAGQLPKPYFSIFSIFRE